MKQEEKNRKSRERILERAYQLLFSNMALSCVSHRRGGYQPPASE